MYKYFKDKQNNFHAKIGIDIFKNNTKINHVDCILCQISQEEYNELIRKHNERIHKIETDKYIHELRYGK